MEFAEPVRRRLRLPLVLGLVLLAAAAGPAAAQGLKLPPSGENQRATVSQEIGPVTVTIDYSSPRVVLHGNDRRGKIWGQLVPYGLSDLGFNGCTACPWRAGANMNTTFAVDHGVEVEGKPLAAGTYGLHMIPGETEWTVIFSREHGAWGSYWYDPKDDALRVTVKPARGPYHEWLTYEFTDREPEKATVALKWEELEVPIRIAVPDAKALWVASLKEQLKTDLGFAASNWRIAADYCLNNKVDLPLALAWAETAASSPAIGEATFQNLSTLWRAQLANGKSAEAAKTLDRALSSPSATPVAIHMLARQLQAEGRTDEAVRIYKLNAARFPGQWPVNVGLLRAYAATGDRKKAIEYGKLAIAQAPDAENRKNLQNLVTLLEQGKGIN